MNQDSAAAQVLLVDDDEQLLRVHTRALVRHGLSVHGATSGAAALAELEQTSFDVIVSDIDMPGMSGIELLARVRERDLDVPVLVLTGAPSLQTAIAATEQGVLRYLTKPVELSALLKMIDDAVRLHRIAKAKRLALELAGGVANFSGDHAGLAASFARALGGLYMVYQPIVSWSRRKVIAYEALLRSSEKTLPHPGALLDAATRLGQLQELGRKIRSAAIAPLARLPEDVALYLNLHPSDLLDPLLFERKSELSQVASRIVLEVTERASLDEIPDVRGRIRSLRELGFRIALDDLGAGYAGLTSFALLAPDVVKLDMALVRDVHLEPTKRTVIKTMTSMCQELGLLVTAEGIESPDERDALLRLGCDVMQGYLFAKPGEAFPEPRF
jgi:EAL domain-containing protein (putative c-di-GMP-specific phosphodiesterase class I)